MKLLREPLLHFALLGGLLFMAQPWWQTQTTAAPIRITAQDQQQLAAGWERETGRNPDEAELQALIHQHVDEELLVREARRLGLHQRDSVVRQRLVRNMRFVDQAEGANEDDLLQAAVSLGMTESDLVVRRRLIQLMRHRIESGTQVTEQDLELRFTEQQQALQQPPRYSFEQVYFSSADEAKIHRVQNALVLGGQASHYGNPFLHGNDLKSLTTAQIERQFGTDFVPLVQAAPIGQWFGPITSAYGKHLIRVKQIEQPASPVFAELRKQLAAELYAEREQLALRNALEDLRRQYQVLIDGDRS